MEIALVLFVCSFVAYLARAFNCRFVLVWTFDVFMKHLIVIKPCRTQNRGREFSIALRLVKAPGLSLSFTTNTKLQK